ncbi:MAG: PorP/SprF family type IX secretion system membrane protein [Lewinellaceae bacterium]|nr:PorP/SprF family type IX secretion system membrane protein [Saprospiraceae bacterium]MCB9340545.1 PorP/SprF family type IX secretion system membrane protein [Lewinellaceae bacterium]
MKKIALLLITGLTCFSWRAIGQQLPIFNQYTEIQTYLNPANIPVDYLQYNMNKVMGLTYRIQWLEMEDSPRTGLFRFEKVREDKNLMTWGGMLFNDHVGASDITGIYGKYAYQVRPAGNNNLLIGLGLTAGLLQYRLDGTELEFDPNDVLKDKKETSWLPDFGLGLNLTYYPETGTKWYAGVSLPQTFGLSANFKTGDGNDLSIKRVVHLYSSAGAIFAVGQQGFLEPSIWVKYAQNAPLNIDFNLRQKFVNNFWMGLGYGTSKNVHLEMGMILNQLLHLKDSVLRAGFGFDYNIAAYGNVLGTTYELNVGYAWGK